MDLIIFHTGRKYIVETKIWRSLNGSMPKANSSSPHICQLQKAVTEGYYVVFDHRETPEPRIETETIDGLTIRSYVIPVVLSRTTFTEKILDKAP